MLPDCNNNNNQKEQHNNQEKKSWIIFKKITFLSPLESYVYKAKVFPKGNKSLVRRMGHTNSFIFGRTQKEEVATIKED